jgi:phosphoribosylformylglycinamidine synthase subunit PurQ / glutaminase
MKCGVITFPGSNCDRDLIHVLSHVMGLQVESLWHKDQDLKGAEAVFLPGGFSYGDYLRSGAIARFAPIMRSVVDFAERGGPVIGICNGFQILTEAGLLPGALMLNTHTQFICQHVWIKPITHRVALTQSLKPRPYRIPIAHAEGNYLCDANTLRSLWDNEQVVFQYCSESGEVDSVSNPNGSLENIAGICNLKGNVVGMMPHPERVADPNLRATDGLLFFQSLVNAALTVAHSA